MVGGDKYSAVVPRRRGPIDTAVWFLKAAATPLHNH
jgi:hypothetical protein